MARQRFCGAPLALRTLTHPRAAGARWRASTARSALGRRTGAIRCPAPRCLSQVQHTMPNTKNAHGGWASTRERVDIRAQRSPRAGCSHTPPTPCSQSSRSTVSSLRMGSRNSLPLCPQARTAYPSSPRRIWPSPPRLSPPLACPRPSLADVPAL